MPLQVRWSASAKEDIRNIYTWYRDKSQSAADTVLLEVLQAGEFIQYPEQYQADEYLPGYRRVIVRHYKLVYRTEENHTLHIVRVFDTRQDPRKLTP